MLDVLIFICLWLLASLVAGCLFALFIKIGH